MTSHEPLYRVVLEVHARGVNVRLVDSKRGVIIEDDRFLLEKTDDDLTPAKVAKDVFDLLYQCANTSVNDGTQRPL